MKPLNAATSRLLDTVTAGLADPCASNAPSSRTYDAGGYMPAVVERLSAHRYSVAHYYRQNGDSVADPDLEVVRYEGSWYPVAITHPPPFGYSRVAQTDVDGAITSWVPRAYRELRGFATVLLRNIREQQEIKVPRRRVGGAA